MKEFGGWAAMVTLLAEVATATGAEGGTDGAAAVSPSAGFPFCVGVVGGVERHPLGSALAAPAWFSSTRRATLLS